MLTAGRPRWASPLLLLFLAASLGGCASTPTQEVYDPLEPANRAIYRFNDVVDRAVLEPVARGYRYVAPAPVRRGVRNFLANLRSPVILANDLLQGEGDRAGTTLARFMINTTIGLAGVYDIASDLGHPPHEEDFGQTLGRWGLGGGPYLMLPLLGPSNARDTAGRFGDYFFDPLNQCCVGTDERLARFASGALSEREQALELIDDLRRNTLDPYATIRSAYAQRRAAQIRNGAAPIEDRSYDDIFKDPEADGFE
jgi:phospholipid-binding lipoprotein MlaA